jgi:hypothetical protein
VFVNPDEYGAVVAWPLTGGGTVDIAVLSQTGTLLLATQDGPDIQTRESTLIIVEADLPPGAAQHQVIAFGGVAYSVRSIEPDGTGFALIRMEETDA